MKTAPRNPQRPRNVQETLARRILGKENSSPSTKFTSAYWESRLFKNTYTYQGRLVETALWSVKIQHLNVRKTFALRSPKRSDAAREASRLYQIIVTHGWNAAPSKTGPARSITDGTFDDVAPDSNVRFDPSYWKQRLILRKHTDQLWPGAEKEFSVRIEHGETGHFFPLETTDANQAAWKAAQIYRMGVLLGWDHAKLLFPREITIAVFWSTSPVACTYTTWHSLPPNRQSLPTPNPPLQLGAKRILVVENEGDIRRSLTAWLSRQNGFPAAVRFADARNVVESISKTNPTLVLINRDTPGTPANEVAAEIARSDADLPVFTYGIYEDSDHIFISQSGVNAGYMLRRRPPTDLLEPLSRAPQSLSAAWADQHIKKYFQSFFDFSSNREDREAAPMFTRREQQILECLGNGFQDKEIADKLHISVWTVHSHLKNIFEKYRVQTRTEAVIKYLQK